VGQPAPAGFTGAAFWAYNRRMSENQAESRGIAPLFSVIIPLEYHRGQWQRCLQAWQSQTLDKAAFEIILAVPADFPQRDKLSELAGGARLEYSHHSHDIGLCAAGAAKARGTFLFFTESHCWPEPEVLELCLQAFHANADWAALSCKSVRVCNNRLSEAEADMYDADIEFGMKVHPWRKILDQCFVTRREAYQQCGGLKPEFGHFSEWLLAASYFGCGLKIEYLPQARIHHCYIGSLGELATFTLDFVQGEIRYFSRGLRGPGSCLLEVPSEWICQDNFERDMARSILRMAVQDLLTSNAAGGSSKAAMFAMMMRWTCAAIFGDGIARGAGAAVALYARVALMLASVACSRERLAACFKRYIEALIRSQRLTCIRAARLSGAITGEGDDGAVLDQTGFYPLEKYHGNQFRWSESAAAIRVRADAGHQSIRIKCVPVRKLSDEIDLRFYLDGKRIADHAISTRADEFEIRIDLPRPGTCKLGWICRPFPATADPRHLGLPIVGIELTSQTSRVPATDVNSPSHRQSWDPIN
jgi:hypothetical protein